MSAEATPIEPLVERLDHAIVLVGDLDAAARDYAALLGRAPSWRGRHAALGTANALFRLSNTYLELLAPEGSAGIAGLLRARLAADGEGPLGFAFGTDDAERCAVELRARGLAANEPSSGENREVSSGALRRWRQVMLPTSATRGLLVFAVEHRSPESLEPAPLEAEPRAAVTGLDHLVVFSADLEATRALYAERFGIRLALDRTFPERGMRLLFFRVGGVTLEVGGRPDEAQEGADRVGGLAWRVEDVDAIRARLDVAGFDVSEVRPGHKPGTRVCTVRRETHGVSTLLIQAA